jgi:hypothetical protein
MMPRLIPSLCIGGLLSMGAIFAEGCGCATCGESTGDPTFVQRDVRTPRLVQQLQSDHLQAVQKLEREISQLAAMQVARGADPAGAVAPILPSPAAVKAATVRQGPSADPNAPRVEGHEYPVPQERR